MKRMSIIALLVFLLLVPPAAAQIPPAIGYQGVLTDAGGAVVGDGMYSMTFALYDVPSGGTALWSETQSATVAKGIFNVVLGSVTPIELDFSGGYWLGIAVGGEAELAPRIPLSAAAYSFSSMGVYGAANEFPSTGYVGIGTTAPNEPLSIMADATPQVALRAGTANAGYSSIYVQAYSGSGRPGYGYVRGSLLAHHLVDTDGAWRLDVGGAERLRVTSLGNVGIGVGNPLERLDVDGAVRLGASAGSNAGTIRFTGADFEGYDGSTWKSLTAEGGGAELPAGSLGSTLRHNGSTWEAVQSLYNAGTNIGIGTTSPGAHLDVMGTATQKIKIETTTATGTAVLGLESTGGANDYLNIAKYGPSAAGTIAGISAANLSIAASGIGAGAMLVGTQAAEPVHFIAGGSEFMRLNADAELEMFDVGGSRTLSAYANAYGHNLDLFDEGAVHYNIALRADIDGTGGFFAVRSLNDLTVRGAFFDGNYNGLGSPRIDIIGSSSQMTLDATVTGNASVVLPSSAISSTEMLNETGAASYAEGSYYISLTGGDVFDVLGSRSITAPSSGYALVIGTLQCRINHTNGMESSAYFGVSWGETGVPANQDLDIYLPADLESGIYNFPVTVHRLMRKEIGSSTYYLLGRELSGSFRAYDIQLTVVFIPTAYGTVDWFLAGESAISDDEALPRVLTAADLERERLASIEADNERIRIELEQMRAEFERLRAEVSDNRQ